jgi:O-antigen/teichoic acid export membrane protein
MIGSIRQIIKGDSLGARAKRSTMYTVISFGGENFVRLAGNLVLTRLLFPEAFGLMALIMVVMTGLAMFSDLGTRAAIIQNERGSEPAFLNTAFTIQVIRGIVLWVCTWILAVPVADFYGEPELAQMLPVAGLTAFFAGFQSTRMATASRDLQLGRLTALQIGTQGAGLLITIALAFWMRSVWALVIGGLATPFLLALLSHVVLTGNRDRLQFEKEAAGQLIRFGKYIFLSTLATFLINHGDRAILGKFTNLSDLALYNIAYFMASVPIMLTNRITGEVLFPVLSKAEKGKLHVAVAATTKRRIQLTLGMLLLSLPLIFFGDWIIALLYDPRYDAAGLLLILIALAYLPVLIEAPYGAMPLAAGHSARFAVFVITAAVLRVAALFIGASQFGIIGVALAPAAASMVFIPFALVLMRQYHHWYLKAEAVLAVSILATIGLALIVKWEAFQLALVKFPMP